MNIRFSFWVWNIALAMLAILMCYAIVWFIDPTMRFPLWFWVFMVALFAIVSTLWSIEARTKD